MADVIIRDMGFQRAVDRLTALRSAQVRVGVFRRKLQKYAAILSHKYGWKAAGDFIVDRYVDRWIAEVQRSVIDGRESFDTILRRFGRHVEDEYRKVLRGETGIIGDPATGPGLIDTGALYRGIQTRVKLP